MTLNDKILYKKNILKFEHGGQSMLTICEGGRLVYATCGRMGMAPYPGAAKGRVPACINPAGYFPGGGCIP